MSRTYLGASSLTIFIVSCLSSACVPPVSSNSHHTYDYDLLSDENQTIWPRMVLPANYAKEIRPPTKGRKPVTIDINIYVVDINSINVEDMDFRVDLFIYETWIESRLSMPHDIFEEGDDSVSLPPEFFDNLWQPDPYFLNSKVSAIAALNQKHSSVTLFKNKTVRYSARMHAIIACQMEFQLYPMDVQVCPMHIESFSYDTDKLVLRWGFEGVTVNPELKLLQYNLEKPLKIDESVIFINEKNGNFSRLIVFFQFERQIGHHLIQTFAPSTLVVMLSWFSFWLGLDAIPGRVTLLVTSMLTLVTMFTGLKTDIPPIAYVKALDLWMAGCMIFVFAALGEFVVVKVIDLRYQSEMEIINAYRRLPTRMSVVDRNLSIWDFDTAFSSRSKNRRRGSGIVFPNTIQSAWLDPEAYLHRPRNLSKTIDNYSRIVFPGSFLVFVLTYWPLVILNMNSQLKNH